MMIRVQVSGSMGENVF